MVCVLEVTEGMEAEAVEGIHRRLEVAERQRDFGAANEVRDARPARVRVAGAEVRAGDLGAEVPRLAHGVVAGRADGLAVALCHLGRTNHK